VRRNHIHVFPPEPRNLPEGIYEVKQKGLAQMSEADILQRLPEPTEGARMQPRWRGLI
jgi:hypothetical protein